MSTKTTNLNLDKPELGDTPNITMPQLASNFEIIDVSLAQKAAKSKVFWVDPVQDFGADPTGTTDSAPAILNAIQYMKDNKINKMKFPDINGTFIINQAIVFGDMDDIDIDGGNNLFKSTAYNTSYFVYGTLFFLGSLTTTRTNIFFHNFRTINAGGYGIRYKNCKNLTIRDCVFDNSTLESIFGGLSENVLIDNCKIDGSTDHGISFDLLENSVSVPVSNWTVQNCIVKNCKFMGIDGHSAAGTFGRILNNTIINCGQITKNQSGLAVFKGNYFKQTADFVGTPTENMLAYFNQGNVIFEDNRIELLGNKGSSIQFIIKCYSQGTSPDTAWYDDYFIQIKGNRIIDKGTTPITPISIMSNDNTKFMWDVNIQDNYIESNYNQNLFIFLQNTKRTRIKNNTMIIGLSGVYTTNYYGIYGQNTIQDLDLSGNMIVSKGTANFPYRAVYLDGVATGVVKVNDNIIRCDQLNTGGSVYPVQFIRGTGLKMYLNNYVTGLSGATVVLGTDVIDTGNQYSNVTVSKQ